MNIPNRPRKIKYLPSHDKMSSFTGLKLATDLAAKLGIVQGLQRLTVKKMIDEYYEHHGWDEQGVPTPETLTRLGLDKEPSHMI